MKYYLAVDKGNIYRNSVRFNYIELKNIHNSLIKDNNLRELCTFTMSFQDIQTLKEFLIHQDVLKKEQKDLELKIIYLRNGFIKDINVPTRGYETYFKISNLASIITKNQNNDKFMRGFLSYLNNRNYNSEAYYELRSAYNNSVPDYIFFDRVTAFLNSYCYYMNKGKKTPKYRSLYDVAMITYYLLNPRRKQVKEAIMEIKPQRLSGSEREKLEEWNEKKIDKELEGQMNLFHM